MENNDDNKNEQIDFDAVPTLAEMKQKRFEQNGGDPMHELDGRETSGNGSKNLDYNDLTNLHKSKIRDDIQYNNYDMNNNNYHDESMADPGRRRIIIRVAILVIFLAITPFVLRYFMVKDYVENNYGVLSRDNSLRERTVQQAKEEEGMLAMNVYLSANDSIENAGLSDIDVKQFNAQWNVYDNEDNVKGSNIRMLLKNVKTHNESDEERQIGVNINANDATGTNYTGVAISSEDIEFIISNLIDTKSNNYSVKCNYDNKGYVYEIEIVEK